MFTTTTDKAPAMATRPQGVPGKAYWVCFALLMAGVLLSSLAVVYTTYNSRHRLNALQQVEQKRNAIQVEYGRLLLEQSSLVSQGKVEDMAVAELGMETPDMNKVVVLGGH